MTPDELIAALAPSRLPPALLGLDRGEALALFGLGLLAGLAIHALISPLLARRPSRRAQIRATRGLEGEERLLAIARILGRLPKSLRPAAYGAAPVPPDAQIERLARDRE
ncbi:hypothetical protein [Paracoccus aminophilus]|uniref:Uncharacterized protein n=1 Tax=Paracoccus aminophilus JCM 7686 TaxID=1367847 RepID=S5YYS8_PARAH|nr:hypothetical protein [Paracoccus aminophilus]AGT10376.1 hypothetical protein JCM7686_3341 [Paracoccus aminophilus JCM 7686]